MRPFTAVVNPTAGRGTGVRIARQLAEALPAGLIDVAPSESHAHARHLAAEACAMERTVLAVGGDGLASCVAGAVVEAGGVLGLVPTGRGNDFARQLGLPAEPAEVARVIQRGRTRTVDVLECDGRIVLGNLYAGVDSVANAIANARPPVPPSLVYRYSGVAALLTFRPVGFRLVVDGRSWMTRGYSVVVANSGYYGAGMHIVPGAEVDDGQLDVLVIGNATGRRPPSRWSLIASMRAVYAGTHLQRADVEVRRGKVVDLALDRSVPVYADGEPFLDAPLRVSVRPAALRVLT